jgi:tetratricopeptide (TPR) repeat protein
MTGNAIHQDRMGFGLSTASGLAAAKYQEGVDLYMSGNAGAEAALKATMAADPRFALAPAALSALYRDTGRHDEARQNADLARSLAADLPRRERQHVEAIALTAHGEGERAFALMRAHLAEFPRDALILLRADRHVFYSGGEDRQRKQLDLLDGFAGAYDDDWWFPGQYGFALGECGDYDRAERLAERSLALNPKNFWGAHTLAHVFADTKDDDRGAAFLGPWLAGFDARAPMFGHASWHLTLFELGRGRHRRAMEVYDGAVRPAVSKHRSTLNNAASFLWRCMLYGYPPSPAQWEELQALAAGVAGQCRGEWDDMNAALAFAGAGNRAGKDKLVAGLKALADKGHATAGAVGVKLVEGAWAFAQGDYDAAIALMAPVIGRIAGVGGSNAQHEVFWDALIEAYLRTGRFEDAEAVQRSRLDPRPTVRDEFRLGRAQLGAGRPKEAAVHLRRAAERWRDADGDSPEVAAVRDLLAAV